MKRKFKNITIPYFYFDDKNNNTYFIYQDNKYYKLNELFKSFIEEELTYHIEINKKIKEVHNLEDVAELLINNYKKFKIPTKYHDEYSANELSYFQKLQKKLMNEDIKLERELSYDYQFRFKDLKQLKYIKFTKKIYTDYKDIIIPKKIYSKEYKNYYYVVGGRCYQDIFYALEDIYLNSFYYQFNGPNRENLYNHSHAHSFEEVIRDIFNNFNEFKINKFQEEHYSKQELDLINKLCSKLKQLKYKSVNRKYDKSEYEEYCYLKDNKKYIRLFIHNLKGSIKDIKFHKEVLKSHKI